MTLLTRDLLDPEQLAIVDHIKTNEGCAIWVEMGELGKTAPVLTALVDLIDQFEVGKVLVISHKRIAKDTWSEEIQTWEHVRHLRFSKILGPEHERIAALSKRAEIYMINREMVGWLVAHYGKHWPFDTVVFDEVTSFGNPSSKRFKAIRRALLHIRRVVEMTGTPASNGYLKLWSQIYLIDRGERLGRTYTAFKQRYFAADYWGYNWTLKDGAAEKIQNAISDICLRVEVPEHRKVTYDTVIHRVKLPDEVYARYQKLERDFLLELESEEVVSAASAAALRNKLQQFANGAIYYEDQSGARQTEIVHDVKLQFVKKLIAGINGPVLLAYNFESDLERFRQHLAGTICVTDKAYSQDLWSAGKIPILTGHPNSFGHGLNLQKGGNSAIWFGPNWDLELELQFNRRLPRRGQKERVTVHKIIAENTIDKTILAGAEGKFTTQKELLDALRVDIERRL